MSLADQNIANMSDEEIFSDDDLALLDKSLDEIEDLPSFEIPPSGSYIFKLTRAMKKVNNKIAVEVTHEVMSCIEQNNPEDKPATPGDKFSVLFFLTGDPESTRVSIGLLKRVVQPIAEATGVSNMRDLIKDHLNDVLMSALLKKAKDKNDPDIFRARLSNYAMAS